MSKSPRTVLRGEGLELRDPKTFGEPAPRSVGVTEPFGDRSGVQGVDSVPYVRGKRPSGYLAESTLEKSPANGALRERRHHRLNRRRTRPGQPSSDGNRPFGTGSACGGPAGDVRGELRQLYSPERLVNAP